MIGDISCARTSLRLILAGRTQSNTQVYVTVWAKGRTEVDTELELQPKAIDYSVHFEDGSRFVLDLELFDQIVPRQSTQVIKDLKIEHFIKAGDKFYKPVPEVELSQEKWDSLGITEPFSLNHFIRADFSRTVLVVHAECPPMGIVLTNEAAFILVL